MKRILTLLVLSSILFPSLCARTRTTSYPASVRKLELAPGDTVYIADGVYEGVKVRFSGKGTAEAPIVLCAKNPGGVTFSGASQIVVGGSHLVVEGFRFEKLAPKVSCYVTMTDTTCLCRVSNCLFDGSGCELNTEKSCYFVQMRGSYNEISGCAFLDKPTLGVSLGVNLSEAIPGGHIIKDNFFHRPTTLRKGSSVLNGQECIRVGSSYRSMQDAGCIVSGNWFYRCDGEVETISNKSCGNLYEGNLLEECVGTLTLRHGNDCTVRCNYFLGNGRKGTGGVRIIGERHIVEGNKMLGLRGKGISSAISVIRGYENPEDYEYFQVVDAIVRGNEIVDCDCGLQIALAMRPENVLPPRNLSVQGNVIVCNSSRQKSVSLFDMPEEDIVWKKNIIFGGLQEGTALPRAKSRPATADHSEAIARIRANVGKGMFWKPVIDNIYEHSSDPKL